ncbi:MAG: GNAT family N-acetyltransferase [Clostridiales bacterium]|nr:GNAT family N-acetyltransferase [Clostridiales bacterium]
MLDRDIIEQIKKTYFEDPTSLPTAFWKYENWLSSSQTRIVNSEKHTAIILDNRVIFSDFDNIPEDIMDEKMILFVSKKQLELDDQWNEEVFFKLFSFSQSLSPIMPSNHRFEEVKEDEMEEVFKFILDSYENTNVCLEDIKSWRESELFDRSIWIWLVDSESSEKVALGICEHDKKNREGILDWIQVNEAYRGKGYGKILVKELMRRFNVKVDVITVSGDFKNKTNPEALYRVCGFEGNQNWFIYKKK